MLGQGAENLKHGLAARRSRVDGVLQGNQVQAAATQVLDDLNQVLGRAAQPVEPPDNDGIARPRISQQFFPTGLVSLHTGNGVRIDVVAAGLAQGVELQGEHLLACADAGVAEFLHGKRGQLVPERGKTRIYGTLIAETSFRYRCSRG